MTTRVRRTITLDSLFLEIFAVRNPFLNPDFHENHVDDVLYNQYIRVDTVYVNFYLITSGIDLVTLMSIFNRISLVFLSFWIHLTVSELNPRLDVLRVLSLPVWFRLIQISPKNR